MLGTSFQSPPPAGVGQQLLCNHATMAIILAESQVLNAQRELPHRLRRPQNH